MSQAGVWSRHAARVAVLGMLCGLVGGARPSVAAPQEAVRLEVVQTASRRLKADRLGVLLEVRNSGEVTARDVTVTCTVRDFFDHVLYSGRKSLGSLGRGQVRSVELTTPLTMSRNVLDALGGRVPLDLREGGGMRQVEATITAEVQGRR